MRYVKQLIYDRIDEIENAQKAIEKRLKQLKIISADKEIYREEESELIDAELIILLAQMDDLNKALNELQD